MLAPPEQDVLRRRWKLCFWRKDEKDCKDPKDNKDDRESPVVLEVLAVL